MKKISPLLFSCLFILSGIIAFNIAYTKGDERAPWIIENENCKKQRVACIKKCKPGGARGPNKACTDGCERKYKGCVENVRRKYNIRRP